MTASYEARFAGHPFEIVGIHDARSLAEGYNRAAAQSTGDVLVFSHDDIELVTPDFAQRLLGHLEHHDGVGVAGASQARGPRWGDAGQRAIHGHILHAPPPGRKGALLMVSGFQLPVVEGIRLLDGAFIAVRRHVWEATRFDAERYDGFHFYDLDFTWRASDAGARSPFPPTSRCSTPRRAAMARRRAFTRGVLSKPRVSIRWRRRDPEDCRRAWKRPRRSTRYAQRWCTSATVRRSGIEACGPKKFRKRVRRAAVHWA